MSVVPTNTPRFSFIGFGEAGQAMAAGLREAGVQQIAVWDILFTESDGDALTRACETIGARVASSACDAVKNAEVIVSAVTAASSIAAAQAVAEGLSGQPFYLDINSVSPNRKRETEALLGERVRYVDVAVMSPIHPARHRSPMHIAGPHVGAIAPVLEALDMRITLAGRETGAAAAIKMIRGVIIKGIEALTEECFVAAQRAGVVEEVADSIVNNYPALNWREIMEYNLERMASHGVRRAAEMQEVADTLRELGVEPLMAEATVRRQQAMGLLGRQENIRKAIKQGRIALLEAVSAAAAKT